MLAGVAAAVVLAAMGFGAAALIDGVPAAPLVLLCGVLLSWILRSDVLQPGARWSGSHLLRVGVALLGAQLSVAAIVEYGIASIAWIALAIGAVFAVALVLGRRWSVPPALRVLIAAGIAVCGNSAIVAVAPLVRAERAHVAVAVAVITLSGTLAVIAYPLIGSLLGMSQVDYGLWTGIAIADTGQVLAAALAYGREATDAATVTKLTRNAFIGPLAIVIAVAWSSSEGRRAAGVPLRLGTAVPPFVVAFVVLAVLRSLGVIDDGLASLLAIAAGFIILVGLAGIGLNTRIGSLMSAGMWPLILGAVLVTSLSTTALLLVLIFR